MNTNLKIIAVILVMTVGAVAQEGTRFFGGSVGESRVEMTLTRDGNKLSGKYSYVKVGKALALSGSIGSDGSFTLTESAPTGATSGVFSGKWSASETSGAAILQGEWKDPSGRKARDFYLTEQMIFFTGGARFTTKTVNEVNKPKMFEISAEYPQISGVRPTIAAAFNTLIRTRVTKATAEFRKAMLSQTAEDIKWAKERGMSNTCEISYGITYADDEIVSIVFQEYQFTGGAHGNTASSTITFDLKTGREVKLADLFKPRSNYLQVLSDFCVKKLKEDMSEMTDADWIETGAGAKAENYRSWNLTKIGLVVNFDAYQVAAYAAGPQEVLVPYTELSRLFARSYGVFASK